MGSDVFDQSKVMIWLTKFFYKRVWVKTIVKSREMLKKFPKAELIPNGVNFKDFYPVKKSEAISLTKLDPSCFNILFISTNPDSKVKNIKLAKEALSLLANDKVKLTVISDIQHQELNYYYNAGNLLLLTSLSEGSPNVIKEAMACNCPIVATDVGDIKSVIGETEDCYVTGFNSVEIAEKIKLVIKNNNRTNGRENIEYLESNIIAKKIIALYQSVLK